MINPIFESLIPKGKIVQLVCPLAKRSWLPCSNHPSTYANPTNRKCPLTRLLPFGALTVPLARVWSARYILLQRRRQAGFPAIVSARNRRHVGKEQRHGSQERICNTEDNQAQVVDLEEGRRPSAAMARRQPRGVRGEGHKHQQQKALRSQALGAEVDGLPLGATVHSVRGHPCHRLAVSWGARSVNGAGHDRSGHRICRSGRLCGRGRGGCGILLRLGPRKGRPLLGGGAGPGRG